MRICEGWDIGGYVKPDRCEVDGLEVGIEAKEGLLAHAECGEVDASHAGPEEGMTIVGGEAVCSSRISQEYILGSSVSS